MKFIKLFALGAALSAYSLPLVAQLTQAQQKALNRELNQAIIKGNKPRALRALDMGAQLTTRTLENAIQKRDIKALRMLLASPQSKEILQQSGADIYYDARSKKNALDLIKLLIASPGFNPNQKLSKTSLAGHSPLTLAGLFADEAAMSLLLELPNVDVNDVDIEGSTPLFLIVNNLAQYHQAYSFDEKWGNTRYRLIKLLLDHGADPQISNKRGWNVFNVTNKQKIIDFINKERAAYLKKIAGEAPKILTEQTPLPEPVAGLICEYAYPEAIKPERPTQSTVITAPTEPQPEQKRVAAQEAPKNTETKISAEQRAAANQDLFKAIDSGSLEGVKTAIKNGADVNAPDYQRYKKTALMLATEHSMRNIAEYLLTLPALEINTQDAGGHTALIWAIRAEQPAMVRLLLANRAAPNIDDASGQDAYWWANNSHNKEIKNILEEYRKKLESGYVVA